MTELSTPPVPRPGPPTPGSAPPALPLASRATAPWNAGTPLRRDPGGLRHPHALGVAPEASVALRGDEVTPGWDSPAKRPPASSSPAWSAPKLSSEAAGVDSWSLKKRGRGSPTTPPRLRRTPSSRDSPCDLRVWPGLQVPKPRPAPPGAACRSANAPRATWRRPSRSPASAATWCFLRSC